MPRYLPLFKGHHIGRLRMRARVLHNGHEPVRQFQDPFRLAMANRFISDQLFADTDGAGASAIGVGKELITYEAIRHRKSEWILELAHRFMAIVKNARAHTQSANVVTFK